MFKTLKELSIYALIILQWHQMSTPFNVKCTSTKWDLILIKLGNKFKASTLWLIFNCLLRIQSFPILKHFGIDSEINFKYLQRFSYLQVFDYQLKLPCDYFFENVNILRLAMIQIDLLRIVASLKIFTKIFIFCQQFSSKCNWARFLENLSLFFTNDKN